MRIADAADTSCDRRRIYIMLASCIDDMSDIVCQLAVDEFYSRYVVKVERT